MRNILTTNNLIAVSALNAETAINTEQTIDTGMLCDRASMPIWLPRNESNADEATGHEEPDTLYNLGATFTMGMDFSKMQAQHFGFIAAYALGSRSVTGAGAGGYRHTIIPINGDLDAARSNPSFTLLFRAGQRLITERHASCFVDSFTLTMAKDQWLKLSASIKGTGKRSTNNSSEDIAGFTDGTSLTLAGTTAVDGTDAPTRVDNVHSIQYQVAGTLEWVDVPFSVVSDAGPAIITHTAPGGGHVATTYRVVYNILASGAYAYCVFPARQVEPPLRITDFAVNFGGKWSGTALLGGHAVQADINTFTWNFNNNLTPEYTPGAGSGVYANRGLRQGRNQTITFDRVMRDSILRQWMVAQTTFVLYAKAEGSEYVSGHKYTVELVFPKVAVQTAPLKEDGGRISEAATFQVLQDDTYGSVIAYVKNMQATYAA